MREKLDPPVFDPGFYHPDGEMRLLRAIFGIYFDRIVDPRTYAICDAMDELAWVISRVLGARGGASDKAKACTAP